jgi:tRNA threonylcarbamoyladenosine biosynthesis protein TsaB
MKLLAVETATEACSAALYIDGEIAERYALAPREHARLILPMIDGLMSDAGLTPSQLDAIAFGRGPGSFTGVRIATGIVHGIAFGADLPVVPVSTLAAIAQSCLESDGDNNPGIFSAMDARINEIYWGVYRRSPAGYAELIGQEAVLPAQDVLFPDFPGIGAGSGWRRYGEVLTQRSAGKVGRIYSEVEPRAAAIAKLGAYGFACGLSVPVEQALPIYLRDKVAKTEEER